MAVNHSYDIDTENRKFGHDVELANIKAKHEANKNAPKGMNDPFIESKNINAIVKKVKIYLISILQKEFLLIEYNLYHLV